MNLCSWSLALMLAAAVSLANAQAIETEFFSVAVPKGWIVERDGNGSFMASPSRPGELPSISVDSCNRRAQSNCPASCQPQDIRPNFFYFFADQPSAVYSENQRADGFRDLRAIGSLGQPPTYVAASVLCGPSGLVYIGSASAVSLEQAVELLNKAVGSVLWRTPKLPVTTK